MRKQSQAFEVVITPQQRSDALRSALRNSTVKMRMTANQRRALAASKRRQQGAQTT